MTIYNIITLISLPLAWFAAHFFSKKYAHWEDRKNYISTLKQHLSGIIFYERELNLYQRDNFSIVGYGCEETYENITLKIEKVATTYYTGKYNHNKEITFIVESFLEDVRAEKESQIDSHTENEHDGDYDGGMYNREEAILGIYIGGIGKAASKAVQQLNDFEKNKFSNKKQNTKKTEREILSTNTIIMISFLLIGGAVPILALNDFLGLKPDDESLAKWVQRSGAFTIICAIYIESTKINMTKKISNIEVDGEKIKTLFYVMSIISLALSIAGTFTWGYGDVWIDYLLK